MQLSGYSSSNSFLTLFTPTPSTPPKPLSLINKTPAVSASVTVNPETSTPMKKISADIISVVEGALGFSVKEAISNEGSMTGYQQASQEILTFNNKGAGFYGDSENESYYKVTEGSVSFSFSGQSVTDTYFNYKNLDGTNGAQGIYGFDTSYFVAGKINNDGSLSISMSYGQNEYVGSVNGQTDMTYTNVTQHLSISAEGNMEFSRSVSVSFDSMSNFPELNEGLGDIIAAADQTDENWLFGGQTSTAKTISEFDPELAGILENLKKLKSEMQKFHESVLSENYSGNQIQQATYSQVITAYAEV